MKKFYLYNIFFLTALACIGIATYKPSTTSGYKTYSLVGAQGVSQSEKADTQVTELRNSLSDSVENRLNMPLSMAQTSAFNILKNKTELIGSAGSRYSETALVITELVAPELPPLSQGMVNVTDGATGFRMLPDGMVFSKDISIVLPYDSTLIPQGFSPDDIMTYYYDKVRQQWTAIERDSVSVDNQTVHSKVNHFTDFINAIIKTREMPETSAFTPTSIKDLKAADPLAGLQLIQAPAANNNGTANLSYPLELPAGRQGMQPNLALTYNSSGGNGWFGVGWDISIPAITVETRWGVPHYDYAKESEVYLYNGEQLVQKDTGGHHLAMPHRTNQWLPRTGGNVQFYPRGEEAFDSIVRHGNAPYNYWWSVTDRNGITYYYGKQHADSVVDYNAVLKDINGNIAHWALTETVDAYGNSVKYYYDRVLNK